MESIARSRELLKAMWMRVENLDAQIQTNQRSIEASKKIRQKK